MEITMGMIMFYGGIAGAALCILALAVTGVVFTKQRKKLLEKLQED